MSDILWQTFNDTYTNSIRNSSFNNYSDKVSFNNYSDKHFWKMIYNILIKILPYIHSNYERYMMNKFHIHFTTFTSQHSSKSGDDSSTNFQHIMHHILSTNFHQYYTSHSFTKLSQQIGWQIFHQIFHKTFATNWVTDISSNLSQNISQQIGWQIFHHIIHHDELVTS